MKKIIYTFAIAIMLIGAAAITPVQAQRITDNAVFYHSIRSPWSNTLNPSLFPKNSGWYVTTAKTSLQFSLPFSYQDLNLKYDQARNVTVLNVNDLLDYFRDNGCNLYNNNDINLLGFGFTVKDNLHFSASAGVRTLTSFTIPLGILDFITQGNINETNTVHFGTQDIFSLQAYAYASVSAAFKLPVIPLTIGGRLNILDGVSAITVDDISIDLTTSDDVSVMRVSSDYMMHMAGITQLSKDENEKFTFSLDKVVPMNIGYTFDLGAKYELGLFDFSLSIVDLGPGIKWKQNPVAIVPKNKDVTISFDGVDFSSLITQGTVDTSFLGQMKDSLMAMIDYTQEESSYWYSVPTRMYAGVSASLGELVRVGYLFQGQWYNGWFNNHRTDSNPFACNNTLSAHLNLFNWMELSLVNSFTYDGNKFTPLNPGMAITLSPGKRAQFFAAVEYLTSMNPEKMKAFHLMFGLNLVGLRD